MNGSKVLPGGFSVFQEKAFTIALPALGVVFLLVAAFIYLNSRPKMVDWSIDHNNSSSRNNIINNSGKRREAQPVESSKTSSLHFWFFKVSCLKKIVSFFLIFISVPSFSIFPNSGKNNKKLAPFFTCTEILMNRRRDRKYKVFCRKWSSTCQESASISLGRKPTWHLLMLLLKNCSVVENKQVERTNTILVLRAEQPWLC